MYNIFREYDIRGIYDKELNEKSVKLLGYLLGVEVKKVGDYVAIGYDARVHSPILKEYLTSGFNKAGVKVLDMGLVATPVAYFANYEEFNGITPSGSVMITGSHNPKEYNGFKITIDKKPFFGSDIYRLRDEFLKMEDFVIEDNTSCIKIPAKKRYIDYLTKEFEHLKGMDVKIVVDGGNGVAGVVLEPILNNLELNYKGLYLEPNGEFPNHHPDPTIEENLKDIKEYLKDEYEIGFAYDGDADRIAVLTKKHNIKGDILAILFAKNMKRPIVIGEVKCSSVMYDEINKIGKAVMYKTGHSNLKVKMKELGADLAAEVSGHIFFGDRYFGYDDAIYATLRVLELLKNGMDLDKEIESLPKVYSTEEIKIKTSEDKKFELMEWIKEILKHPPLYLPKIKNIISIDGVRINFENGWGLIRASNTTPVLVTRFEAKTKEDLERYQKALVKLINTAKESL
ncbi:MAG: phosphomannomutase/phosphoglucomutase [Epsilonproteobacteria bacterium]|nr:phosphomannomutase/phosphoglucomutase [Campylobacterota bacterium]